MSAPRGRSRLDMLSQRFSELDPSPTSVAQRATRLPARARLGHYGMSAGLAGSLRLDVGGPDHVPPLLGFVGDKLAEIRRSTRHQYASQFGQANFHVRVR